MVDLFIYGPPGAGKSWIGALLEAQHGYRFEEGDAWLTNDMHESLRAGRGFTQEQRDYYAEVVAQRIGEVRAVETRPLVVAQAMLKRRSRRIIAEAHPGLLFVRAAAEPDVLACRLRRGGNLVDENLGAWMAAELEVDDTDPVVSATSSGAGPTVEEQVLAVVTTAGAEVPRVPAAASP